MNNISLISSLLMFLIIIFYNIKAYISNDLLILSVAAYEKSMFCFFIGINFFKDNFAIISLVSKALHKFLHKIIPLRIIRLLISL
jgi:hypothetical protein